MDCTEKILEKEEVFKGSFITVENIKVKLPDGNKATRDVVRHPGAVAIVAFKDEETIILVEQFRVALNKVLLEIPAGKLEKGEDIKNCAHRELEEETGFKAKNMEYLGAIATGAGFTDEVIHIYKATELYEGVKGGDEDEFINVKYYKLQDIRNMIKEEQIIDVKTISSLAYL